MSSFKVKIKGPGGIVIFQASAPVSESRSANYEGYNITHLPTDLWAYRNTTGRKFQITGKLVSRTGDEAGENAKYLNLIRKWILPDFGGTGATPPILKFSAYDNDNIDKVPVILKAYSFTFPEDIDYIFDGDVPMPVIATLNVDLDEAYTAEQITEKAWKINEEASGFFENGGAGKGSSSFEIDFPPPEDSGGGGGGGGSSGSGSSGSGSSGGGFGGIANSSSGIQTAGNILSQSGFGRGNSISNLGGISRLLNSSLVLDVDSIISIQNNPFIRGISPERLINEATNALIQVAAETSESLADAFGRNDDLEVPIDITD